VTVIFDQFCTSVILYRSQKASIFYLCRESSLQSSALFTSLHMARKCAN